jgi:hypothetical protein
MSILRKAAKGFFEGAGEFQKEVLKDQMANRGWMRRQKYLEGVEAAKYARNRSGQQEDWVTRADITRKSNLSVRATKLASTLLSAGSNKYRFDNTGNLRGNDVTAVAQLIDGFMRGSYTNGKPVPEAQASELAMSVITSKMRGVDDKSPYPHIPSSEVIDLISGTTKNPSPNLPVTPDQQAMLDMDNAPKTPKIEPQQSKNRTQGSGLFGL